MAIDDIAIVIVFKMYALGACTSTSLTLAVSSSSQRNKNSRGLLVNNASNTLPSLRAYPCVLQNSGFNGNQTKKIENVRAFAAVKRGAVVQASLRNIDWYVTSLDKRVYIIVLHLYI